MQTNRQTERDQEIQKYSTRMSVVQLTGVSEIEYFDTVRSDFAMDTNDSELCNKLIDLLCSCTSMSQIIPYE